MIALSRTIPLHGADGSVLIQTLALIPPVAVAAWVGGLPFLGTLAVALVVVLAWDYIFATLRQRAVKPYGITTAAIFVLFVPPEMPLWHLVVVLSLGSVIAEHVFGGRGFAFLSPATAALALGLLSLPNLTLMTPSPAIAWACLPGAVLLLLFGMLSVPIALVFLATLVVAFGITTPPDAVGLLAACSVALLFLVCDPLSAAVTGMGRVLYGALAGVLAWVFSGFGGGVPSADALVFAALLASLFAPLLDTMAVAVNGLWRRRRYG
ncbi:hypothetical protein A8B78_14325 [Jannaschia sp. EhC01]|nr:hypothetical protein A8B78_14325 [Jannaschia sp. EhC01]